MSDNLELLLLVLILMTLEDLRVRVDSITANIDAHIAKCEGVTHLTAEDQQKLDDSVAKLAAFDSKLVKLNEAEVPVTPPVV